MIRRPARIEAAKGKLGVLLPGMGAVTTTFMAGVELVRRGKALPVGSVTQMGTIRLGKRTEFRTPRIKEFVPLAALDDLVFGGWDIFTDNAYQAAQKAGVLEERHLQQVKSLLSRIKPMRAVFDANYVRKLQGKHIKKARTKWELAQALKDDIAAFKAKSGARRLVMVWCGSTEVHLKPQKIHQSVEAFERALKQNHEAIAPSMIYAYAAITSGVPFANGAPNLTVDIPAMVELAGEHRVPLAGKDFKTGQTLMKTIIAPGDRKSVV